MPCLIRWDVKNFTLARKCRLCANGSVVDSSGVATFSSVVSRESVRIAFTLAALNGLDVLSADCEGAYLNAPPREKVYTKCGPEWGELSGRWAIIIKALYGLSSSSVSWRAAISSVIEGLGFTSCRADPDVWLRPAVKADGLEVYEYVLVYSDDLLMVGIKPEEIACQISQHYKFKGDLWEKPTQYLGGKVGQLDMPNGKECWYLSSEEYCKRALENLEGWLSKKELRLPTRVSSSFPSK